MFDDRGAAVAATVHESRSERIPRSVLRRMRSISIDSPALRIEDSLQPAAASFTGGAEKEKDFERPEKGLQRGRRP